LTLPFYCVINTLIARLYEQGADKDRIGQYVKRWNKWATAGLWGWWFIFAESIEFILGVVPYYDPTIPSPTT
jgi:hypothetical protein